jgi:gamma-glutamyltranspeptidase/glutathione hydrolase
MPRLAAALLALLLALAACSEPGVRTDAPATAPALAVEADAPARSERGLTVSARQMASEAGARMLRHGGNAVDAAVATGFALAVVHPRAGNVGGGGFTVIRFPEGRVVTVDHREKAPLAATEDMYLDSTGAPVPQRSRRGYLASGTPGNVAGMLLMHRKYGRLPRDSVLAPAIRMAAEGVRLSEAEAQRLNRFAPAFRDYPGSRKYFTKGGLHDSTRQWQPGDLFVQKDLAATLRRIEAQGRAGFYQGRTARLIAEEMERGGGLITEADLAQYEAKLRLPVATTYRGWHVYGMGPPSSGGVAVAQLLNAMAPVRPAEMGFHTAPGVHRMGEAMRRVFADRAKWLGDSDFVDVPVDSLISTRYMRRRMASFDPEAATPTDSVEHGDPLARESMQTTHYAAVDSAGLAVSTTTTLNGNYGSKVAVEGAGFFLNNEMDDFAAKPGAQNMYGLVGSAANAVAPEKRMLSSMSPTIAEDPQGRLALVTGTPGGSTIITTVFQILANVIDYRMGVSEALAARRVHHQWKPRALWHEPGALSGEVQQALRRRGWKLKRRRPWGRAAGLRVRYSAGHGDSTQARTYVGAFDPRGQGAAVGLR